MISNHTKRISLSYQKFIIQLALINLHPVNYSQDFQYYLSAANKDRCIGSCNFLNDLSKEVCVPNKTEDLNISVFNMITEKNESKILTKDRSCECTCKFDGTNVIQIKSGIMINSAASVKNIIYVKEIIFGNLLNAVVKMVNIWRVLLINQWLRVMIL